MPLTNKVGLVTIPYRFEALRKAVGADRIHQVLIQSEDDMPALKRLMVEVKSAGQGKLMFLQGPTGSGKTSLIESLRIYLSDMVAEVVTPPPDYELSLSDLPGWIQNTLKSLEKVHNRTVVFNLDGRELPSTNEASTSAAMVNLNAFLRRTPNVALIWPVINEDFANRAIEQLNQVGGQSAIASNSVYSLNGIPKESYYDVLRLILDSMALRLDDAAVSEQEARDLAEGCDNIGEYLSRVHDQVVQRYDLGKIGIELPKLTFVITSSADTNNVCRMIRRGNGFLIDADRLLQFSRSNKADDWRKRGKSDARKSLAFIVSLFEAKLVSASSSAVVNACAFSRDSDLRSLVRNHYPNPVSTNAWNAMQNTSLVRSFENAEDVAVRKSDPSQQVQRAYDAIQEMTNKKHREINEAILNVVGQNISLSPIYYEYHPVASGELRVDAWIAANEAERPEAMEFTHRRNDDCSVAVVASYILHKLEDYARDYELL